MVVHRIYYPLFDLTLFLILIKPAANNWRTWSHESYLYWVIVFFFFVIYILTADSSKPTYIFFLLKKSSQMWKQYAPDATWAKVLSFTCASLLASFSWWCCLSMFICVVPSVDQPVSLRSIMKINQINNNHLRKNPSQKNLIPILDPGMDHSMARGM